MGQPQGDVLHLAAQCGNDIVLGALNAAGRGIDHHRADDGAGNDDDKQNGDDNEGEKRVIIRSL